MGAQRRRRTELATAGVVAVCALAACALAACDTPEMFFRDDDPVASAWQGRGTTRDAQTVIVGRPSDVRNLDPALVQDNESVEVCEQIYDKLVHYRPGTNEIVAGLAREWKVSDDGKVWTFRLRSGVRFHDGTPLDAAAVVFSFERQRDPFHPFHTSKEDYKYWTNNFQNVVAVEAIDTLTVRITIEEPFTPFEANMAMFPVGIISPTAMAKYGKEFDRHPVGTGPFRFVSWEPGRRIVLERNPDYWGGAPSIERLVFQTIPDGRQRLIALEGGSIDIAYSILPEELQFVELHPGLVLYRTAANNVAYLAMNTTHPPFDDLRVRRAANYAVNKEPIVKLVYQGQAVRADGALPPSQWGYHPLDDPYTYQPERSRTLLTEAQAEGRFDPNRTHTMYVPSTPRPYLPAPQRVARVLQANLADVGIKTRLVIQDLHATVDSCQQGVHDLCLLGWVSDNGDPDNYLYTLLSRDNAVPGSARNVSFFSDAELSGLLEWAQRSDDRANREKFYARAQELAHSQAPWVPIAHSQVAVAARTDLTGVVLTPSNHVYYNDVRRVEP